MRVIAAAVFAAVFLSAAVACGGDDGGTGGSEAARAIQPEAQERAESLLLTLSDFPDGWRAQAADESDDEGDEEFRNCVGSDYSALTLIGEAESDDFAMGTSAEASSTAEVFESEQMAADGLEEQAAGVESDAADGCMAEFIPEPEDDDFEWGEIEVGPVSFTPPSGVDEAQAWQVVLPVEGEGVSVNAYLDVVVLRVGDTVATVRTSDVLSPFDSALRDELVDAIASRMNE